MRKYVSFALILLLPLLSSCIDFGLHYLIRENGSVRVVYDLVLDKSLWQLLYTTDSPGADSTTAANREQPPPDTSSANVERLSNRPFKMSKEVADSIRRKIFGAEIERLRKEPAVLSAESKDSLAYDGVHFLLTTELRSYRDVSALHAHDSARKKQKFHLADSIYVAEHGDSIMFMIADLSSLEENSTIPDFPNPHVPIFKKTRYTAPQNAPFLHKALWSPQHTMYRASNEKPTLHWYTKYADARKESQKTGKNLLLYFTRRQCSDCREMEENVLKNEEVDDMLDGYVLVSLSTDNGTKATRKNLALEDSLLNTTEQPYFVILTPNEEIVARFSNFSHAPSDFLSFLRLESLYLDSKMVATDDTTTTDEASVGDSDENPLSGGVDSLMKGLDAFTSMFSGLLTVELSIESPLIIGHDPSAVYDATTHTATWNMDVSSFAALKEKSADDLRYYVWLRKPKP